MAISCSTFLATMLCGLASLGAAAPGFLAAPDVVSRDMILDRFRSLLGHGANGERLNQIAENIRPMYLAVPKTSEGGLEHRVVRYVLYRYFLIHRGWHIKGLALDINEEPSVSPTMMLKSRMPTLILDTLEEHLNGNRLGLDELAVLAATVEDLVHGHALELLHLSLQAHDVEVGETLSEESADLVLQTYTVYFVLPDLQARLTDKDSVVEYLQDEVAHRYPGWKDTWMWVQDIMHTVQDRDHVVGNPFSFARREWKFSSLARVATLVVSKFGRESEVECRAMKNALMDMDTTAIQDGRVRLDKFYAPYLQGTSFFFSESPAYLKHLGALDEVDPSRPRVIVPNVIYAQSNCLGTSGFHAICCIDQCEALMASIEDRVRGPSATVEALVRVVSELPSETVAAPRSLSPELRDRLEVIASRHGGEVPLHGRLFAQWMHFSFPNDCPYPRSLLTDEKQLTSAAWENHTSQEAWASASVMQAIADSAHEIYQNTTSDGVGSSSVATYWSDKEELLVDGPFRATEGSSLRVYFRVLAAGAAVVGMAGTLLNALRSGKRTVQSSSLFDPKAHMV